MRRMIALLTITGLVLAGCRGADVKTEEGGLKASPAADAEASGSNVFTRESFPRIDGSTSMIPLGEAIAAVLLGESRQEVSDLINFRRTSESFRRMKYGDCDIIISARPSDTVIEELEKSNFNYSMEQFATDALVFIVKENNPVTSLTPDEIRGIYSGEITNWSQVGGEDVPVTAFQRNADSGSQVAMESVVMADIPMAAPPSEYTIGGMETLISAVRNFDGTDGAIGYSVYYYVNNMQMDEGIKILEVDGTAPGIETISSGEYQFTLPYYVTIPDGLSDGSPARIMRDWLLGSEGRKLVRQMNYVPCLKG